MALNVSSATGTPQVNPRPTEITRITGSAAECIHTDAVYNVLLGAVAAAEDRLAQSLDNYQQHPDVQANLQQLQYDLASWNLTTTTMTNINKSMSDALNAIASNFR